MFTIPLKKTIAVTVAAAATALPVAALTPAEAAQHAHQRGDLVSVDELAPLDTDQVATRLKAGGYATDLVRTGVTVYRIDYRTVDARRRPTTASGLVVLPDNGQPNLRLVFHGHGTETNRHNVPSVFHDPFLTGPALTYGSAGYAAAAPDYLGLGDGPGLHPYFDLPSETTASVDMLRATRELAAREGRSLRRGIDVTGFSQGASVALGLARAIERHQVAGFSVHALAPISGAYDLRGAEVPALLDGRVDPADGVVYAAYLLVAWNRLHHLYRDTSEVFRAPYAARVERIFDGRTAPAQMIHQLPSSVDALLTPAGLDLLRHPTRRLAAAEQEADGVCQWPAQQPVRLFYAEDDEQAVNANTASCRASFARAGTRVQVRSLGRPEALGSRHLGSAVAGALATAEWFEQQDR